MLRASRAGSGSPAARATTVVPKRGRETDLRKSLSAAGIPADAAGRVLNYQPFILSNDMQTGVAYSWFKGDDPRSSPQLLFRRGDIDASA